MTKKEIENKAYLIATGSFLNKSFTKDEFNSIDNLSVFRIDRLKNYPNEMLFNSIIILAKEILSLVDDTTEEN